MKRVSPIPCAPHAHAPSKSSVRVVSIVHFRRPLQAVGVSLYKEALDELGLQGVEEALSELGLQRGDAPPPDETRDARIDLRSFLAWYIKCRDDKRRRRREAQQRGLADEEALEEAADAFLAVGGRDGGRVTKQQVEDLLLKEFHLELDLDKVFDSPARHEGGYDLQEFERLLIPELSATGGLASSQAPPGGFLSASASTAAL